MLLYCNADPDSIKRRRYESGSKWLANNEEISYSLEGCSFEILFKEKEENITAVNVELLLSFSR
jgi:hypothetical protein